MPAIRVEIKKELHKQLKMIALQDDTTLQNIIPILLSKGITHHTQAAQQAIETASKAAHRKKAKDK